MKRRLRKIVHAITGGPSVHAKPAFIIIGAQKAGTTALFEYLSKHPQIVPGTEKEIDFFSCDGRFRRGEEFYHSHFPILESMDKKSITFEASGDYLANLVTAKRIFEYKPKIKLIAILRDPSLRAFSAWNMYVKYFRQNVNWFIDWMTRCDETFKENLIKRRSLDNFNNFDYVLKEEHRSDEIGEIIEARVLQHGKYSVQLKEYYKYFDRRQLLILENEEMKNNTAETLKVVTAFLELNNYNWERETLAPIFAGEYDRGIPEESRQFLSKYYKPYNEDLYSLLGKRYKWI